MPSVRPNTIDDCVKWATAKLAQSDVFFGHGCDNPRDEAIWATLHVTGLVHLEYEAVATKTVSKSQFLAIRSLVERRIETHEPLAYLVREAWFAGYAFYIDQRAIVPRSHFGDLIQDGFGPWFDLQQMQCVLDLCCGSGCIAIALALTCPHLQIDASEIDSNALEVATINIDRHRVNQRVHTIQSNLFEKLSGNRYDLILCNPPYIAQTEMDELPKEYSYEPRQAFVAGNDGLLFVSQILRQARNHLTDEGYLLIELGHYSAGLEKSYPDIPFLWLTSRSGESVVLLFSKQELDQYSF